MNFSWGGILASAIAQVHITIFGKPSGSTNDSTDHGHDIGPGTNTANANSQRDIVEAIHALDSEHETSLLLQRLIRTVGADNWPPKASHGETWPAPLREYHTLYHELAPSLSCNDLDMEVVASGRRVNEFRARMRQLLEERVRIADVKEVLLSASSIEEEGRNSTRMTAEMWNGFYACVAWSRHAYRWGTIPVLSSTQMEKIIEFPPEIAIPWQILQTRYGTASPAGTLLSNCFSNFGTTGDLVYRVNYDAPDEIMSTEFYFSFVFNEIERVCLPMYLEMIRSIIAFESGQIPACITCLQNIDTILRHALRLNYTLVKTKVSKAVWLSYVQGFQAWAAGEIIDGSYVEYDGLSGSHLPLFNFIDAFLELPQYLTEEIIRRSIPQAQTDMMEAIRRHSFRKTAAEKGITEVATEMNKMIKQLRLFRASHRPRVKAYLSVPAAERKIMTAAKSVLESDQRPELGDVLSYIDDLLATRQGQTV